MFAYGPADATAPSSLASFKSRLVLPFWYQLTPVVPEKRPLDGCSSSSIKSFLYLSEGHRYDVSPCRKLAKDFVFTFGWCCVDAGTQ